MRLHWWGSKKPLRGGFGTGPDWVERRVKCGEERGRKEEKKKGKNYDGCAWHYLRAPNGFFAWIGVDEDGDMPLVRFPKRLDKIYPEWGGSASGNAKAVRVIPTSAFPRRAQPDTSRGHGAVPALVLFLGETAPASGHPKHPSVHHTAGRPRFDLGRDPKPRRGGGDRSWNRSERESVRGGPPGEYDCGSNLTLQRCLGGIRQNKTAQATTCASHHLLPARVKSTRAEPRRAVSARSGNLSDFSNMFRQAVYLLALVTPNAVSLSESGNFWVKRLFSQ